MRLRRTLYGHIQEAIIFAAHPGIEIVGAFATCTVGNGRLHIVRRALRGHELLFLARVTQILHQRLHPLGVNGIDGERQGAIRHIVFFANYGLKIVRNTLPRAKDEPVHAIGCVKHERRAVLAELLSPLGVSLAHHERERRFCRKRRIVALRHIFAAIYVRQRSMSHHCLACYICRKFRKD